MSREIEPHLLVSVQVVKLVGTGAYGHVWQVRDRRTGNLLALKKVCEAFRNVTDAQRTYRQTSILQQCQHPNIVRLLNVIRATNDLDLYLIMDYSEADLSQLIARRLLTPVQKRFVVYQLAKGLQYLHVRGVIHRDLKPSNVLIGAGCHVRICDFGLSRTINFKPSRDSEQEVLTDNVATRWYCAPQILLSDAYGRNADSWSLGCIIAEMVIGRPLLTGSSLYRQLEKIIEFTGSPSEFDIDHLQTDHARQLITQLREVPKRRRLDQHNSELVSLVTELLKFNPRKRLTMQELLGCSMFDEFRSEEEQAEPATAITLELNDNRYYPLQRYRQQIYQRIQKKKAVLKQNSGSKRKQTIRFERGSRKRLTYHPPKRTSICKSRSIGSMKHTSYDTSKEQTKREAGRNTPPLQPLQPFLKANLLRPAFTTQNAGKQNKLLQKSMKKVNFIEERTPTRKNSRLNSIVERLKDRSLSILPR